MRRNVFVSPAISTRFRTNIETKETTGGFSSDPLGLCSLDIQIHDLFEKENRVGLIVRPVACYQPQPGDTRRPPCEQLHIPFLVGLLRRITDVTVAAHARHVQLVLAHCLGASLSAMAGLPHHYPLSAPSLPYLHPRAHGKRRYASSLATLLWLMNTTHLRVVCHRQTSQTQTVLRRSSRIAGGRKLP